MSQVTKTLLDLTQRKNFYAGDLLVSVEILRNVTDTFKRASYIPASDGVQVCQTVAIEQYGKSPQSARAHAVYEQGPEFDSCHLLLSLSQITGQMGPWVAAAQKVALYMPSQLILVGRDSSVFTIIYFSNEDKLHIVGWGGLIRLYNVMYDFLK